MLSQSSAGYLEVLGIENKVTFICLFKMKHITATYFKFKEK